MKALEAGHTMNITLKCIQTKASASIRHGGGVWLEKCDVCHGFRVADAIAFVLFRVNIARIIVTTVWITTIIIEYIPLFTELKKKK